MTKKEAIIAEAEGVEAGLEVLWANLAENLTDRDIEVLQKMEARLENIKQHANALENA